MTFSQNIKQLIDKVVKDGDLKSFLNIEFST